MKKNYWFRVIIFLVILISTDRILGIFCACLYSNSTDGSIQKINYSIKTASEDNIILGSSRAQNHFIPSYFNKNIGGSTYNCGFGGQGLQFSFIQLNEIIHRRIPNIVILEVSPNILQEIESIDKLKVLLPLHFYSQEIHDLFVQSNIMEELKFSSKLYPYNSTIISLIYSNLIQKKDSSLGFVPLYGLLDTSKFNYKKYSEENFKFIPSSNILELEKIIHLCRIHKINLFLVISPIYNTNSNFLSIIKQTKVICDSNQNLHLLDYSTLYGNCKQSKYFKDPLHLNILGAMNFSDTISKKIKEYLLPKVKL